jgi:hypothetical protein
VQKSEWSEYCCISIFGVFINGWMFTDGYIAAIRNLGLARFRFVLYTHTSTEKKVDLKTGFKKKKFWTFIEIKRTMLNGGKPIT